MEAAAKQKKALARAELTEYDCTAFFLPIITDSSGMHRSDSTDECMEWLRGIRQLEGYTSLFEEQGITGEQLLKITYARYPLHACSIDVSVVSASQAVSSRWGSSLRSTGCTCSYSFPACASIIAAVCHVTCVLLGSSPLSSAEVENRQAQMPALIEMQPMLEDA